MEGVKMYLTRNAGIETCGIKSILVPLSECKCGMAYIPVGAGLCSARGRLPCRELSGSSGTPTPTPSGRIPYPPVNVSAAAMSPGGVRAPRPTHNHTVGRRGAPACAPVATSRLPQRARRRMYLTRDTGIETTNRFISVLAVFDVPYPQCGN